LGVLLLLVAARPQRGAPAQMLHIEVAPNGGTPVPAPVNYRQLQPRIPSAAAPRVALFWGATVDLNRADARALQFVRGIGDKLAQRLLAARARAGGRWQRWSQVDDVRGVGPALLARLQAHFRLPGAAP